jgi:hypothetical protein
MASMMDEMARTLARRRAAAEKKDDTSSQVNSITFFYIRLSLKNKTIS